MAEKKVTVLASFIAKPGLEDEVKEKLLALVAPTRSESGCINYDLHQDSDDPRRFMLYENWKSLRDLEEHLDKPYLKALKDKEEELFTEPIDITLWEMIS